ncbi:MAG: WYL domain-containing protein [Dysosmobacter welbionis]
MEPCRLVFRLSSWYLWGWCREREDFRLFKLNRMLDLELAGRAFHPRRPPIRPQTVYPAKIEAAVRFQPPARWRLVDEYGRKSFTEEPDGTLLFRAGFPGKAELLHWTLTFGDQAELLEP